MVALSSRGKVLTDIYGEANRRAPGGTGVPTSLVLPPAASIAEGLRLMALVGLDRGRPDRGRGRGPLGRHDRGPRPRRPAASTVQLRSGGRPPRGHAHAPARGRSPSSRPLRDVGFDRGSVRFTADQQGTAYQVQGHARGQHGDRHDRARRQAARELHPPVRGVAPWPASAPGSSRSSTDPSRVRGPARRARRQPLLDHARPRARLGRPLGAARGAAPSPSSGPSTASPRTRRTSSRSATRATARPGCRSTASTARRACPRRRCSPASTRWSSTCRTSARATTRSSTRCCTSWRPARARASAWSSSTARTRIGGDVVRRQRARCPSTAPSSGMHPLAVRHGMTAGELALMFARGARARRRPPRRPDEGLAAARWPTRTPACPGCCPRRTCPTVDTAFVYPGGCLVEGTNLSEGRGTTRPFELVGAPWLDGHALARDLEKERIPGAGFRAGCLHPDVPEARGRAVPRRAGPRHRPRAASPPSSPTSLLIHHARAAGPRALRVARAALRVRARQAAHRHPVRDGRACARRSRPASRRSGSSPGGAGSRRPSGGAVRSTCSTESRVLPEPP